MARIIFFKSQSRYNVLTSYVDADVAMLKARGHTVKTYFPGPPFDKEFERDLLNADLLVGYVGWGLNITNADGKHVLPMVKAPFLGLLGDHPAYLLGQLAGLAPHHHLVMSSQSNITFAQNTLKMKQAMHMGMCTYTSPPEFSWDDRDIEILVAGTVIDPNAHMEKRLGGSVFLKQVFPKVFEVWRDKHNCQLDAITLFLATVGQEIQTKHGGLNAAFQAAVFFDVYCRNRYRVEMIRKLKDFPLTLVGSGWKTVCAGFENSFTFLESVEYPDYISLLRRTKVAINLIPPSFDFHERIVDSAANGAALVTNPTEWVSRAYKFQEHAFALGGLRDNVADRLSICLRSPQTIRDVAEAGARRVRDAFTEDARADAFEEFLQTGSFEGAFAYSHHSEEPAPN